MPGFQQPRGGNFEPRPMLADPVLNLKHRRLVEHAIACSQPANTVTSTVLCRRITVLVGENEIPVALPMIYLTKYSALFRAAFDGQRRFIESVTKEIRLPEENPRDFLLLARFLIQAPASLKEIQHHHWPYLCEPKDQCTWCDDEYLNTTQTPLHFRFCVMVERLGFTFPEEMYWSMLSNAAEGSPTLVQPATVEWAMQNSLEGGYFRRYVAKLLATVLKDGQTAFETYEAVLSKYPDMCLTMLKEGFSLARPACYECVPEQRAWTYHRRTAMKQSVPSSP